MEIDASLAFGEGVGGLAGILHLLGRDADMRDVRGVAMGQRQQADCGAPPVRR